LADKGDLQSFDSGSVSSDGSPVVVTATATPGTALHVHSGGTSDWDQVGLTASNTDSSTTYTLVLEVGGTGTSHQLFYPIRPQSTIQLDPVRLSNGKGVYGFVASGASKINVVVARDNFVTQSST
jgi:hypothetical protein